MSRQAVRERASTDTEEFTVRLSIDDLNRLDALSDRTGKTKESIIRKLVSEGTEDMVDVIFQSTTGEYFYDKDRRK